MPKPSCFKSGVVSLLTAVYLLASCSDRTTSAPQVVASVAVTIPASLEVGQSIAAAATVRDQAGAALTGRLVSWSSSNPTIATITPNGVLTALGPGTTTVTATVEGRTGNATLTVTPVPVATVAVTLGSASITLGATTTAAATVRDAANNALTGRAVTWSSSDVAIATITPAGVLTALAPGTTTVTATVEGRTGNASLTVTPVPVATVAVALGSASITVGATTTAVATVRDAANNSLTGRAVTWSSSDAAIATITPSGSLTALAPGTTTVTATVEGRTGSASLRVLPHPPVSGKAIPSQGTLGANELRAYLVRGPIVDSADVTPDGSWTIRPSSAVSDSADVIIDRIGNGTRRFHPVIARTSSSELARAVNTILIPRQWTIARGRYRGTSIPVSLESAYTPSLPSAASGPQGLSFFLRNTTGGRITYTVAAWNLASAPFPIAFDRSAPNGPINPADSIGFWASMKTLQEEIGLSIFRPANFSEITTTRGIRVTHNWTDSAAAGRGAFTVLQNGTILGGWIGVNWIGHFTLQSGFDVQKHEMGHVFGLGHTCAWKTIMYAGCDYETSEGMVFTPTDVAYFEVLYRVDELQRQWNTRIGLPHSHQGERVRMLGRPRESFIVNGFVPGATGSMSVIRFHGDHIH